MFHRNSQIVFLSTGQTKMCSSTQDTSWMDQTVSGDLASVTIKLYGILLISFSWFSCLKKAAVNFFLNVSADLLFRN